MRTRIFGHGSNDDTAVKKGIYRYNHGEAIVQLRVEEGGHGMLFVDGMHMQHMNSTACEFVKLYLEGLDERAALKKICRSYRIGKASALRDYRKFVEEMRRIIEGNEGKTPECYDDRAVGFPTKQTAPMRLDMALTYRCNNKCAHCYIPSDRFGTERKGALDLKGWKRALDAAYEAGVPHVCFTGGEPTLVEHLPELVSYARSKNLITGLITNGRALSDEKYVNSLVEHGLDHVQITLESHIPEVHDRMVCVKGAWDETVRGIKNCVGKLHTITNTTLTTLNEPSIEDTLAFLKSLGIRTFASNSLIHSGKALGIDGIDEGKLAPVLKRIVKKANELSLNFLWYTPTRYCVLDPVELGLGPKQCSAVSVNMCVEPDGGMLPCQSFYEPVGNILNDDFTKIWSHDRCEWLRERKYAMAKCRKCAKFETCGCGCPLFTMQ